MAMIDKLSERDLSLIKNYISTYAGIEDDCYASETRCGDIKHILRFWDTNKAQLGDIFKGELILTRDFSFEKPMDVVESEMYKALMTDNTAAGRFYNALMRRLDRTFYIEHREVYWDLLRMINTQDLWTNTVSVSTIKVPVGRKKVVIPTGCKLIKAIGKLAAALEVEGFEDFRLAHSMVLNQKHMTGQVCLSIHPLDYMTMSDNDCDWDSCMSWQACGDYRQGTVEMMNSPYVVIAYLKSSHDMTMPSDSDEAETWNNKRWRQLYIVHPEMIMSIRQYPYDSDVLNGFCLKWLRSLVEEYKEWGMYQDTTTMVTNNTRVPAGSRSAYFNISTNAMYNDVHLTHSAYLNKEHSDVITLNYSGESECMECGAIIEPGCAPTNSLLCHSCGYWRRCDCCGAPIPGDGYYYVDDEYLCETCANNECSFCNTCDEYVWNDDMRVVYLVVNGHRTTRSVETCIHCINNPHSYLNRVAEVHYDAYLEIYYVNLEDFIKSDDGYSSLRYHFEVEKDDIAELQTEYSAKSMSDF